MAPPTPRPLTDTEDALGWYAFKTLPRWREWMHRRVEQFEFPEPYTLIRRVSLDFTVPPEPTPLQGTHGDPIYCVPLALLRKRRLRRFDLRSASGESLPLLTRGKN